MIEQVLRVVPASAVLRGMPSPGPDADEARRRAEEILSGPEFDRYHAPPPGFSLPDLSRPASVVAWIVVAIVVAVMVLVVIHLVRSLQREPATPEQTGVEVSLDERRRRWRDWIGEAERLEAAGDWKEGLRARYRALVALLVERDAVRDLPGRTTGELRAELAERVPPASPPFSSASELFEHVWYGAVATGPAESQRFQALAGEVSERAGQGTHRARRREQV